MDVLSVPAVASIVQFVDEFVDDRDAIAETLRSAANAFSFALRSLDSTLSANRSNGEVVAAAYTHAKAATAIASTEQYHVAS